MDKIKFIFFIVIIIISLQILPFIWHISYIIQGIGIICAIFVVFLATRKLQNLNNVFISSVLLIMSILIIIANIYFVNIYNTLENHAKEVSKEISNASTYNQFINLNLDNYIYDYNLLFGATTFKISYNISAYNNMLQGNNEICKNGIIKVPKKDKEKVQEFVKETIMIGTNNVISSCDSLKTKHIIYTTFNIIIFLAIFFYKKIKCNKL